MSRGTVLGLLVLLAGCPSGSTSGADPELRSQVLTALAERDRRVVSYRFDAETVQGTDRAAWSLSYRAPGRLRADLRGGGRSIVFDGTRLLEWGGSAGLLVETDLGLLPKAKSAQRLHALFAPLAPEGWRAPLVAGTPVAERGREDGREVVRLRVKATDTSQGAELTYLFAPPRMDFLGKRVTGGGTIRVVAHHCEESLGLCFPRIVEDEVPGASLARTTLTDIRVNAPVPPETFALAAPEGARVERR